MENGAGSDEKDGTVSGDSSKKREFRPSHHDFSLDKDPPSFQKVEKAILGNPHESFYASVVGSGSGGYVVET